MCAWLFCSLTGSLAAPQSHCWAQVHNAFVHGRLFAPCPVSLFCFPNELKYPRGPTNELLSLAGPDIFNTSNRQIPVCNTCTVHRSFLLTWELRVLGYLDDTRLQVLAFVSRPPGALCPWKQLNIPNFIIDILRAAIYVFLCFSPIYREPRPVSQIPNTQLAKAGYAMGSHPRTPLHSPFSTSKGSPTAATVLFVLESLLTNTQNNCCLLLCISYVFYCVLVQFKSNLFISYGH